MKVILKPYIELMQLSKRLAEAEAKLDAMRYGHGYIKVNFDGTWERIQPRLITVTSDKSND